MWLGEVTLPKELPAASESKGTGPHCYTLSRLERRCDGEGRQGGRGRLVEDSNECNDPKEDEGTEALRAVHRLVRDKSSEHAFAASRVSIGSLSLRGHTGVSSLAGAGAVVCSVVFVSLAGFWCIIFFVAETVARFEAADFFAISFASSSA